MYKWPLMKETVTNLDRLRMMYFIATTKRFTSDKMVKKFENEWNKWLGAKHSLFVSSGSTANFLLIDAIKEKYNLKNGDKVLVPSCTWMTNVAPIIQLGLTPVFADINLDNFSFDVQDLKQIKSLHPDIKVIFVTHLLGFPADNDVYKIIFPNAVIIDDVCESHGCTFKDGSKVGSNSTGATFSFYFGHHMTTVEGGMVSTNDTELYDIMKMKRSHGLARESLYFDELANKYNEIDKSFLFITDGYNFRNHEIPAVLGIAQLKRLDKMISIRRRNYESYRVLIQQYSDKFYVPEYNQGNSSFCFPFVANDRYTYKRFKFALSRYGIEHRPIVSGNLMTQPFLQGYRMATGQQEYNVDRLQYGLYIGNNHFVNKKDFEVLKQVLDNV
jgi:CDP-6-deoxy-D-xylo-4-hexulose-3-dehydrase